MRGVMGVCTYCMGWFEWWLTGKRCPFCGSGGPTPIITQDNNNDLECIDLGAR